MGTTPSANDQIAEVINNVISALAQGGEAAALVYLNGLDPALMAVPFVDWLVKEGLSYLGSILSVATQKVVTGLVIDIQTNGESSAVLTAATALAIAQASGDANAIQGAVDDAVTAWGNLIHWDGTAVPVP